MRTIDMSNEPRNFSCVNCGNPYEAYPPNDENNIATQTPCNRNDSIEIKYECDNCNHINAIHWDKKHSSGKVIKTKGYS